MRRLSAAFKAMLLAATVLIAILGVRAMSNMQARADYDATVALHVEEATDIVANSLDLNFHALRDIAVIMNLAGEAGVSQTEAFHRYVDGSDMFGEFTALRGMAVFEYVRTAGIDDLVARHNRDPARAARGYPPLVPKALAEGDAHAIITIFSPLVRGLDELGADIMARDRAIILREAINRQTLTISPHFTLFNGEKAVSLFRPYYSGDEMADPTGFVATALSTKSFFGTLKSQLVPYGLELSVADLGFSDEIAQPPEPVLISSNLTGDDRISLRDIAVGGRVWRLGLRPVDTPPPILSFDPMTLLAAVAAGLAGFLLYRTLCAADQLGVEVRKRTAELDAQREEALKNARSDELTGLLNRRGLNAAFSARLLRGDKVQPTLISLDLDNFKQINDTLGHASGDDLLCAFAKALTTLCPNDAILARFGGDEFGVLLFDPLDAAEQTAQAILTWSRQPHHIGGHLMRFGASAGVAQCLSPRCDLAELVVNADIALYAAKDQGRDRICLFDDAMRKRVVRSKTLADDIWRGLENDEFVPFFQSQHDAGDHALNGVEVLVRWQHPERGTLPPGAFLDVADKIGATKSIDRRVLELAAAAIGRLEAAGYAVPKYSVNVSLNRMLEPDVLPSIAALPPTQAQLTFEILESDFLDDPSDTLLWRLDQLRDAGVGLEVDDFGSGRASIIALRRLNPDRLKIDKALILPLREDPALRPLVSTIVEMARTLQIGITAEGVETEDHARIVADLGVDTLQGFHFSKPVPERALLMSDRAA